MENIWLLYKRLPKGSTVRFIGTYNAALNIIGEVFSHRTWKYPNSSENYTLVDVSDGLMFEVPSKSITLVQT
jgi:hypothetical protein